MTTPGQLDSTLPVPEGYTLVRRLGGGTFGEVWEALAPGKVKAALKFIYRSLDSDEAQRELQSLEILKKLEHDHLLEVQAFWQNADRLVIAMPLAAGGSLRDRLQDYQKEGQKGIPPAELIRFMHDTADALDYLHESGVLHRDVKPDNILLRGKSAKLADFGLLRDESAQASMLGPVGTPPYMAPEIWRYRATKESDQYALACTFAELRCGHRPFPHKTRENLMVAHMEGEPDLSRLPLDEQRVLLRALAKEPNKRFGSCREFIVALEAAVASASGAIPILPFVAEQPGPRTDVPTGTEPGDPNRSILPGAREPQARQRPLTPQTTPVPKRPERKTNVPPTAPERRPRSPEARQPETSRWSLLIMLLLACLAGLAAVIVFRIIQKGLTRKPKEIVKLVAPAWVHLGPGQSREVALQVERDGFTGPVELSFTAADGIRISGGPVPEGATEVTVKVEADQKARLGPYRITVAAQDGGDGAAEFDAHVLPAGLDPADGVQPEGNGTAYFPRVVRRVGDQEVVFVLVRPGGAAAPFYLMQNKVWNSLFRVFADAAKEPIEPDWQKGGMAGGKDVGSKEDLYPVFRVTRSEAERFAAWLGGRLPSPAELGYVKARPRVRNAAVGRWQTGPRTVNDLQSDDVSAEGVRDLAGNGREWTSETLRAGDEDVAVLAGRSYASVRAAGTGSQARQTQYPAHRSPYTTFRVLIPLDPPVP